MSVNLKKNIALPCLIVSDSHGDHSHAQLVFAGKRTGFDMLNLFFPNLSDSDIFKDDESW